jgi:hypothetical protein
VNEFDLLLFYLVFLVSPIMEEKVRLGKME